MVSLNYKIIIFISASFLITGAHAHNRYSTSFARHIGRRLQCGIIENLVANPHACRKKCTETLKCFSVNTHQAVNGTAICELVKGSKDSFENDDCFEWKTGWEHDELEVRVLCCCFFSSDLVSFYSYFSECRMILLVFGFI